MRVIVIGAGLGGLTLAQGLRRAGIDVVVYGRDGLEGRRQGISLHLDSRGTAALHACLPPEHMEMITATTGGPREHTLLVSEVDGQLAVVGTTGKARPGRQVHRPLLRAILLDGLPVRFGTEFTRFEHRADGTVQAWFADGSTDIADVLVGADGVGSAVRRQYLPNVQVIDTGRRMLMGATPLRAVASSGLPALIGHSATSVQVGSTMMALGVLRFTSPPVTARDKWLPDLRARAIDEAEDYVMWATPNPDADLHPALRLIVDNAWPELTVPLRIAMIPPFPPWPATPVTVLGDAIHAAPGFGGNLAMQDAERLRDALVRADRGDDLIAAIGSYEETWV